MKSKIVILLSLSLATMLNCSTYCYAKENNFTKNVEIILKSKENYNLSAGVGKEILNKYYSEIKRYDNKQKRIAKSIKCIPVNIEKTPKEIEIIEKQQKYSDEELELLAHLIYAEAGVDYCSDEMQIGVGSVTLNRIKDKRFPDTLKEVIYQKGQYACTWDGNIEKTPNERAYKCAKYLLENGSQLPKYVIFFAEFKQGDRVYKKVQNAYFCYNSEDVR